MRTSATLAIGLCILNITGLSAHADAPSNWGPIVIKLTGDDARILARALPRPPSEPGTADVIPDQGDGPAVLPTPRPPGTKMVTTTVTVVCPKEAEGQKRRCTLHFKGDSVDENGKLIE